MASIHKQPGRPFYFCAFTNAYGVRVFRSTKTANKKQALEFCRAWSLAASHARNGHLTPERAREVIAAGVAVVFTAANREAMPSATVRAWCGRWLAAKEIETEPAMHARNSSIIAAFLESLGKSAERDLATLRADAIARFRDSEAKSRARATANLSLKVLRMALWNAVRHGLLTVNPLRRRSMRSKPVARRGGAISPQRKSAGCWMPRTRIPNGAALCFSASTRASGGIACAVDRVTRTRPAYHSRWVDTERASALRKKMSAATSHYHPKCLPNPKSQHLFAGVRGHVKIAVEALPSSTTYSDAMKQVARFRAARKMKS